MNREKAGSALTSLAVQPSALNVGQYDQFKEALVTVLAKSHYFKKSKVFQAEKSLGDVCEFHHLSLRRHYEKLVDDHSAVVFKTLGGTERQVTLHAYIWDALKGAHRMAPAQLDDLCRRLLGDQKLSFDLRVLHKQ